MPRHDLNEEQLEQALRALPRRQSAGRVAPTYPRRRAARAPGLPPELCAAALAVLLIVLDLAVMKRQDRLLLPFASAPRPR